MAEPAGQLVRVEAGGYRIVREQAREFSPLLARELDRALREAGKLGADVARRRIREMPSQGLHRAHHGTAARPRFLRQKIADNIRVSAGRYGVRITSSATGISGKNARGLLRRIDEGKRFRHPTFGRKGKGDWHDQEGWPFFREPIAGTHDDVRDAVAEALRRAAEAIAARH